MQISISTSSFRGLGKPKECVRKLLEAGVRGIMFDLGKSYAPDALEIYGMRETEFDIQKEKAVISSFVQECMRSSMALDIVRAPYLKWDTKRTDLNALMLQAGKDSIEVCRQANAKYIIIQPLFSGIEKQALRHENCCYYRELGKAAQKADICILLENQCEYRKERLVRGVCSNPLEASEWIDALNEEFGCEVFGFCLDICAGTLGRQDIGEMAVELGSRLKAVLLRECDCVHEMSCIPFMGSSRDGERTDWSGLIKGLRQIGFDGMLALDAGDTARNLSHLLHPYVYPLMWSAADYIGWQVGLEKRLERHSQRVLFGAGNMCKNYMEYYGKQYPPLFTCDNNPQLWGKRVCGLEVKSPEALKGLPKECAVVICNTFYKEIAAQLRALGVEKIETFSDEYLF